MYPVCFNQDHTQSRESPIHSWKSSRYSEENWQGSCSLQCLQPTSQRLRLDATSDTASGFYIREATDNGPITWVPAKANLLQKGRASTRQVPSKAMHTWDLQKETWEGILVAFNSLAKPREQSLHQQNQNLWKTTEALRCKPRAVKHLCGSATKWTPSLDTLVSIGLLSE